MHVKCKLMLYVICVNTQVLRAAGIDYFIVKSNA